MNLPVQDTRECSCVPRMTVDTVAGDHDQWMPEHFVDDAVRIHVNQHESRLGRGMHSIELVTSQAFSCFGNLHVVVVKSATFAPARTEKSGVDIRHTRAIRVGLRCYVQTALPRALNELETKRRLPETAAVEMDDMR